MERLAILGAVLAASVIGFPKTTAGAEEAVDAGQPNVVILFCDDLGYGDLGCFGHPTIRTGMCSDRRRVLFPDSAGGLQPEEVTIAEVLKSRGYATACVGKWHLGHLPQYIPTRQGFDSYLGIPYSNDMDRVADSPLGREAFWDPKLEYWNVPLMRNEEIIERPTDQNTITRRYTEEAVRFIRANKEGPFFVYLAHSMPHVPLFASGDFKGRSLRGLFGDVIEEIDWSVGLLLDTLRELGLDNRTLVAFTSDNGPWLIFNEHGGSAGLLRDGKGSTWEGGMREPTLFWWPGTIPPGVVTDIGSTLDLLPTCAKLAGAELPADLTLDGFDVAEQHPDVIAEIRKLAEAHRAAMTPGEPQLEAVIQKGD